MNGAYSKRPSFQCPVGEDWDNVRNAIERSKEVHSTINAINGRTQHLESLPEIASSLKHLNRNLTITLIVLGLLLVIKEIRGSDMSISAGTSGISIGRSSGQ